MKYKTKLWAGLLLVTLISFIDYQYFSEGFAVRRMPGAVRQSGHLFVLVVIILVGFWGWNKHPMQWTKKLWLYAYGAAIVILLLIGFVSTQLVHLGSGFLDRVSDFRLFFCSPLPYITLYMLTQIAKQNKK